MHRIRPTRLRPLSLPLAIAPLLLLCLACSPASSPDDTVAQTNAIAASTAQPISLSRSRDPDQLFPPCNRYDNVQDLGPLSPLGETTGRPFTESYEAHLYTFDVEAGDYVHVVVEQRNVDLVVSLVDEAGQGLLRVDSLYGHRGAEEVHWIEEQGGQRSLLVCAGVDIHEGAGYSVRIQEQTPPTQPVRAFFEAFFVYHSAEANRRRGTETARHEALQLYHEAAELWRQLGRDHDVALAIHGIGRVHTEMRDDFTVAEQYVNEGIELLQAAGDLFLVGASRHRLGQIKEFTGEFQQAIFQYEQALAVREKIDHFKGQTSTLTSLALVHSRRGDYDKAQNTYHRALEVTKIRKFIDKEADLLRSLGQLNHSLSNHEAALASISEALEIHRGLGDPRDIASSLSALGKSYQAQQDFAQALTYFHQANAYYTELEDERNIVRSLIWIGDAEIELEAYEAALATFEKSLNIALDHGLRPEASTSRMFLGWIKAETGNCGGAIDDFEEAARGFEEIQDFRSQALIFQNIAICEKWLGRPHEALRFALRSTVLSEHKRERALSMSWQSKFFAGRRYYFDFLTDVLVEIADEGQLRRQYLQQALENSERSKARTLLDSLAFDSIAQDDNSPQLKIEAQELKKRINTSLSNKLITSTDHRVLQNIDSETRFALERLELTYRKMRPDTTSTLESSEEVLEIHEIRDLLGENTTLLEFHVGYWESHLWLVDAEKTLHFPLPSQHELEGLLSATFRNLSSKARPVQTQMLLEEVSQLLLGDVLKYIETDRLVIAKDGPLHYLPLDTLFAIAGISEDSSGKEEARPLRRVGDLFEVVNTPSMSVLAQIRQRLERRKGQNKSLAVFADPVFNVDDPRITLASSKISDTQTRNATYTGQLDRLGFSRDEATSISRIATESSWSVETFLGFDSIASAVTENSLSGPRILHFATHADFHSRQPEFAYLAFSAFKEDGSPSNEGFLFAYELYDLDLDAELVVLSACSSALGSDIHGEGLVGLTQGFLQSGANQVLVSLWQVDDQASAELMRHFYQAHLGEGLSPSKALWKAKMAIKSQSEWEDPYYWAGFSLVGDWVL